MLIVALTGGIGSGKSTVGQIFGDLGAIVTDSDQLARDVVERGTTGFDQIIAAFGDEVLKNGDLNRAALADLVFKDPAKRKQLEQITHPLIRKAFAKIVESAKGDSIVVNQIPLLVESNHNYKFDHVITVSASEAVRIERLLKRGMNLTQIQQRLQAQSNDAQREKISDSIIRNDNSQADLLSDVEKVWELLQVKNKNKS
ncbi:dephospho-CoA kinase [Candidatus Nanopelagicus limnes]|uniref:Dephospho-CoA kinase n=1 Tax=Candidatus Nanopelagicus limnae TaxID=1884634 RepID=A0A249JY31_9ACTN|nr:dephospho-CoA kinase [Candidatus Nanopelagicus limnes]ASY09434.1 dephospho-CoA kinase [Candidatus Nanopelagicus limnes]